MRDQERAPRERWGVAGDGSAGRGRRRLRWLAPCVLIAVGVALFSVVATGSAPSSGGGHVTALRRPTPRRAVARPRSHSVAVGLRVMRVVDPTRSIQLPDGQTVPRTLVTDVRYPAPLGSGRIDGHDGPVARAGQPFPLIVFGHGFDVTPGLYAPLLRNWARAGYVVAAPVFPLESRDAPGGPNESDPPNQPGDMHVVISRMLAASDSRGPWRGTVDPRAVAVAGQSDGGDTALAVADDPRYRDDRVDAAIILSGAEIPGIGSFAIHPGSPPLLATQGTADAVNPPNATLAFYASAPTPKYLLHLLTAGHLAPYSVPGPQLSAVERVSVAFLDHYLKQARARIGATHAQSRQCAWSRTAGRPPLTLWRSHRTPPPLSIDSAQARSTGCLTASASVLRE